MKKGLVHLAYGNGKGKSTAAMGLALRALGHGWRVCIVQFLKNRPSGEITVLEKLSGVTVLRGEGCMKFTYQMNDGERESVRASNEALLAQVQESVHYGEFDLLILDEVVDACFCGLLDETALISLIQGKPEELEIAMTGHQPSKKLSALSDYVTETTAIKHPFEHGIAARKGIEY